MIFRKKHKVLQEENPRRNTLRSPVLETPQEAPPVAKQKKKRKPLRIPMLGWVQSMLDGSMLARDSFTRALPFGIFLGVLGLFYIANSYYAIRQIRKIDTLTNDMKEYQYEYITSKSALMFHSKPSEIAKRLEQTGIKESVKPPEKIFIND
jgi:hypothetical protein